MRRFVIGPLVFAMLVVVAGVARADDQAEGKAILEKALKAAGGAEKLSKHQAALIKAKGTVHQMGQVFDIELSATLAPPKQSRSEIDLTIMGMNFKVINVLNGDKGWVKLNDMVMEMDETTLDEGKHQLYQQLVTMLFPLKDPKFSLSPLGEVQVEDKPAIGLRVSCKGQRDMSLYFDKTTWLLVKSETRAKELPAGIEVSEEGFYMDYKEVEGVKVPMKFKVLHDGKPFITAEVSEYRFEEKADASLFEKP